MGDHHYTISGVIIGGRNNAIGDWEGRHAKPKPLKKEEVDQSKQMNLFKWFRPSKSKKGGEGCDHPPGAVSFAYSFTPYFQYPPLPTYQYGGYDGPPQMAAGAGHGYYGGYHGPGFYPGQIPPPNQGVYNYSDTAATAAHMNKGSPAATGAAANGGHRQHGAVNKLGHREYHHSGGYVAMGSAAAAATTAACTHGQPKR